MRHSRAPASRPATVIFPIAPCQMLPDRSSACTFGGRKCVATPAGKALRNTASAANATIRIQTAVARARAGRGSLLVLRLVERDAGIDHSGLGGTIDRDRFDRESVALLERREPLDQRIEGRLLQLHANSGDAGGCGSAQRTRETGLVSNAVDQHDRGLARIAPQLDSAFA